MTKQILTIAISCNEDCPNTIPDTCLTCDKCKKTDIDVIEVLDDTRHSDELPPEDSDD